MADISDINMNDLSAMVEKLKSNPEIVSSVASVLGINPPSPDAEKSGSEEKGSSTLPDMISTLAPLLSSKREGHKSDLSNDHLTALLCALRPYLSAERQEIIDYIMKFSKIGDILKKLQ